MILYSYIVRYDYKTVFWFDIWEKRNFLFRAQSSCGCGEWCFTSISIFIGIEYVCVVCARILSTWPATKWKASLRVFCASRAMVTCRIGQLQSNMWYTKTQAQDYDNLRDMHEIKVHTQRAFSLRSLTNRLVSKYNNHHHRLYIITFTGWTMLFISFYFFWHTLTL